MPKEYKAEDGFQTQDLLHASRDHFISSERLFKLGETEYLDSAVYLAHLSVELLLKSFLLHKTGSFPETHSLEGLIGQVASHYPAAKQKGVNVGYRNILIALDRFYELRYPNRGQSPGICKGDFEAIEMLYEQLKSAMPKTLKEEFNSISKTEKYGREVRKRNKC